MLILRCHGQLRCQHRLRPELKSEMLATRWLSITSTRSCIRIRIRCTCTHAVSVALQLFVLLLFNGRGEVEALCEIAPLVFSATVLATAVDGHGASFCLRITGIKWGI